MSFATEKIPGTYLYKSRTPQVAQGTLTLAQINAGNVTIVAPEGRIIQVTGFMFHMNGTFGGLTDLRLQTVETTPVPLITIVAAQMGDTLIHTESLGTHVLAPAYWNALTKGVGLAIAKTGAAATGGTSVDYAIEYTFEG
jgi:hypothetical protein